MTAPDPFLAQSRTQPKGKREKKWAMLYLCSRWAMDASESRPCWHEDGRALVRRCCALEAADDTWPPGPGLEWWGGAEVGGSGRRCRCRDGRPRRPELEEPRWARGARRLPELWTRRDWESTGVGWGLPPAGAVGAVVWGLHRAPAGAAGRRRRSAVGAPRVFYFDRDIFLGDEANKHELRSVL